MPEVKFSSDIRKEFGRYMQQEREARGISQKYLAGKMGISVTQLSRIENGKSGTERDTVILWAQKLGMDENEALRQFKPENIESGFNIDVADNVRLQLLHGEKYSPDEQKEFADAFNIAYGIAKNRIKQKREDKDSVTSNAQSSEKN